MTLVTIKYYTDFKPINMFISKIEKINTRMHDYQVYYIMIKL